MREDDYCEVYDLKSFEKRPVKRRRRRLLTIDEFESVLHLSQKDAAEKLDVCVSSLKRQYKKLHPKKKWPTPSERKSIVPPVIDTLWGSLYNIIHVNELYENGLSTNLSIEKIDNTVKKEKIKTTEYSYEDNDNQSSSSEESNSIKPVKNISKSFIPSILDQEMEKFSKSIYLPPNPYENIKDNSELEGIVDSSNNIYRGNQVIENDLGINTEDDLHNTTTNDTLSDYESILPSLNTFQSSRTNASPIQQTTFSHAPETSFQSLQDIQSLSPFHNISHINQFPSYSSVLNFPMYLSTQSRENLQDSQHLQNQLKNLQNLNQTSFLNPSLQNNYYNNFNSFIQPTNLFYTNSLGAPTILQVESSFHGDILNLRGPWQDLNDEEKEESLCFVTDCFSKIAGISDKLLKFLNYNWENFTPRKTSELFYCSFKQELVHQLFYLLAFSSIDSFQFTTSIFGKDAKSNRVRLNVVSFQDYNMKYHWWRVTPITIVEQFYLKIENSEYITDNIEKGTEVEHTLSLQLLLSYLHLKNSSEIHQPINK